MDYKENTQQGRLTGHGTSKYMQLDWMTSETNQYRLSVRERNNWNSIKNNIWKHLVQYSTFACQDKKSQVLGLINNIILSIN